MLQGILLIVLLLGFLAAVVLLLIKSQLQSKKMIAWGVMGLFSIFGFLLFCMVVFSGLWPNTFKPKLGHFLIGKFSTPQDTIGRLTLSPTDNTYEVFPKNQERKVVNIYTRGKTLTGWLSDGQLTLEPETEMRPNLWYVFFER